jgi:hypothetical protein
MVGGRTYVQAVGEGADGASFTVELAAGPTLLHTWFDDEHNQPICGAYYVYVTRMGS